jgi:hypothetical protein
MESKMKLKLAIVRSCDQDGCIVNRIEDGEELSISYSRLVKGRIKISKDHLVAMDTDRSPMELVWRWIRAEVDQVEAGSVVLDDRRGQLIPAFIPTELELDLKPGEEVWWCKTAESVEVHARTSGFGRAQEERLISYFHPVIEKHYADE